MSKENEINEQFLHPHDRKFNRYVKCIEEVAFTLIILTMIIIGLLPIALRYLGMMGITWTESLSQHMVLWIAFLGAGTAIRERTSISIDAAPHLLKVRKRLFLRGITEIVSSILCGILIWVSISYIKGKLEFESNTIAFLNIREWWLNIALPCGFLLLTIRLLIAAIEDIYHGFTLKLLPPEPEEKE
jgi:TRAP-type C4-dicarboxylate transport system permease small subunit